MPIYNQDGDDKPPAEWTAFRERIRAADAVLFVTPEHNRSVPAALKNAIDVGSRPYGKSAWSGKPGAVISASPGGIGGFGANHHLRQSLVFLNVPAMAQPEAYIGGADKLFDANGKLVNDGTRKFLQDFMQAYDAWITANSKVITAGFAHTSRLANYSGVDYHRRAAKEERRHGTARIGDGRRFRHRKRNSDGHSRQAAPKSASATSMRRRWRRLRRIFPA